MLSYVASSLVSAREATAPASTPLRPEVQQWLVQWEELTPVRLIGRGSFGRVYLALWNETPIACKVLINADAESSQESLELPEATMRELQSEAGVMARMRHPNIVGFMGLCTLPACIMTGESGGSGGMVALQLSPHFGHHRCLLVQSTAAVGRCTTCCVAAAWTPPNRQSSRGLCV